MKRRRFVVALLAFTLAFSGAGVMWWYARTANERALADLTTSNVFVAQTLVPKGMALADAVDQDLLKETAVPASLAPAGSTTEFSAEQGQYVAQSDIAPGELVLLSRFGPSIAVTGGLSIPPGKVAVTLNLDDTQRVASFVQVGSQVAVFVTYTAKDGDGERRPADDGKVRVTRLLMENVLVAGVGTSAVAGAPPSPLITFAVTQDEAERLILASTVGSVRLALMNGLSDVSPSQGVTNPSLFG